MQEREIMARVSAGEIRAIAVLHDQQRTGWVAKVITRAGEEEHLHTKRGREVRLFKTSDAVLRWCERIGLREVTVYL